MIKPKLHAYKKPAKVSEYPSTVAFQGGHLVSMNSGWRTFKPVVNKEACVNCLRCYLICPDGVISKTEDNKVQIDYDFCKGCGVCAHECKPNAIEMIKDGGEA